MVTNQLQKSTNNEVVDLCLAKVNLNVPLLATFYTEGLNDTQIAKRTGRTQQAVSSYKLKHIDEITPLVFNRQKYNELQAAHVAQTYRNKLIDISDTCNAWDKKDIIACTAAADRMTQQERLYGDKSTSNIDMQHNDMAIKDLEEQERVLEAKINSIT